MNLVDSVRVPRSLESKFETVLIGEVFVQTTLLSSPQIQASAKPSRMAKRMSSVRDSMPSFFMMRS